MTILIGHQITRITLIGGNLILKNETRAKAQINGMAKLIPMKSVENFRPLGIERISGLQSV